ncbi:hypothetical protein MRB53_039058 [Persea americana]|nr:hypothetical protein MRB53_039058 [Persea americana]
MARLIEPKRSLSPTDLFAGPRRVYHAAGHHLAWWMRRDLPQSLISSLVVGVSTFVLGLVLKATLVLEEPSQSPLLTTFAALAQPMRVRYGQPRLLETHFGGLRLGRIARGAVPIVDLTPSLRKQPWTQQTAVDMSVRQAMLIK